MTVWVLGDQLTTDDGPVAERSDEPILLIESRSFAERLPYHPHKLAVVFSAMRHFRDRCRRAGRQVYYHRVETFREGLEAHFDAHPDDELTLMRPAGGVDRLRSLVDDCGGRLEIVANDLFCCSREQFDDWADGRSSDSYRHEDFYRFMRRETGYLLDEGDPVGGEWNYDEDNRETPPDDWEAPAPPAFEPDETTHDVLAWVDAQFDGGYDEPPYGGAWADPEPFRWPVTREQALGALEDFCTNRLETFGTYQDAMVRDSWAMSHSLLSSSLNLGLLHPAEVIERAIEAYRAGDAPLNSVEGFVRQVLGWREFLRHVYRREREALAEANQLAATEPLPEFFWTGETEMACLADVIAGVRRRGYAHHIERLMVLSNFATTFGVDPHALNRWFHATFVDAHHWVTTPNVVGMGTFATDVLSTKPYVASSNYVDRMSDYCGSCPYYKTKTVGENACPFNALYWDFLGRNEDRLRSNHRMGLVYSHWDDKDEAEREAIGQRAATIRQAAHHGNL
ncbi:cryptochrome/photolyase family protein [Halorhabdus sp. CBA1104]|uniref:cryptochrome/photolyase family protein n=1 Tax=unclassified Halorhabdus TaxID=2621901 RepID=UPI0012B2670E|nr:MULTISPECIES: cryptochrome/photolyase family protein [unclassified Halorhabdus]QGN07049.1 cryptochrome/photolyase family protein [Halorhabdus sp. CBA1104]